VRDLAATRKCATELNGHEEMIALTNSFGDADLYLGLSASTEDYSLVETHIVDPAHNKPRVALDGPLSQPFHDEREGQNGVSINDVSSEHGLRFQVDRATESRFHLLVDDGRNRLVLA
jgi:hypothetical protein